MHFTTINLKQQHTSNKLGVFFVLFFQQTGAIEVANEGECREWQTTKQKGRKEGTYFEKEKHYLKFRGNRISYF